ncbi:MAG TPA: hypothetical protein VIM89_18410 [Mucilaginibacter sp.]
MEEINQEPTPQNRWKVVGINIGILAVYTIGCRLVDGGIVIDAFLIAIHFFVGVIMSIAVRRWEWLLSAFLVLVIGFSTCVNFLDMSNMH